MESGNQEAEEEKKHAAPGAPNNADLFCLGCGYSLKGLDAAGKCSECGVAVEASLRVWPLATAPAEYLRSIHWGLTLILTSVAIQVPLAPFGPIVVATLTASMDAAALLAIGVPWLLCQILSALGWWLLTARDQRSDCIREGRKRLLVRWAIVLSLAWAAIGGIACIAMTLSGWHPPRAFPEIVIGLDAAILGVWFFPAMAHIRCLALRARGRAAARRARYLVWLAPALWMALPLWMGASRWLPIPGGWTIVGVTFVLFLGPLVLVVLYWNMLNWLRRDVKRIRAAQRAAARAATA